MKPLSFCIAFGLHYLCTMNEQERQRIEDDIVKMLKTVYDPEIPVDIYNLGLIDWRVRLLQLPHELVNKKYRRIRVGVGETLTVEEQSKYSDIKDFGAFLRSKVYDMPLPDNFIALL